LLLADRAVGLQTGIMITGIQHHPVQPHRVLIVSVQVYSPGSLTFETEIIELAHKLVECR